MTESAGQVKAMVQGRDRRPELGYKLAVECRSKISYPAKNKNSRYNNLPANTDTDQHTVNESNHNTAKVTAYSLQYRHKTFLL